MKKISIIVPIYNMEKFLKRCIDSILLQTYSDFELILIDDGSNDKSRMICNGFSRADNRIIVIYNTENKGVSYTRNIGLKIAKGDYISFIDADDWIDANMYSNLINAMEKYKADICIGCYIREGIKGQQKKLKKSVDRVMTSNDSLYEMLKGKDFCWELCDKVYRRNLFENISLNEEIDNGEDLLINFELFNKAKKILYYPAFGYHYYFRENSATTEMISKKQLTFLKAIEEINEKIQIYPKNIQREVGKIYYKSLIFCGMKIILSQNKNLVNSLNIVKKKIQVRFWRILFANGLTIKHRISIFLFLFSTKKLMKIGSYIKKNI